MVLMVEHNFAFLLFLQYAAHDASEQASRQFGLTGNYIMDEHLIQHTVFALLECLVKQATSKRQDDGQDQAHQCAQ
jgi:hypothetical protein